MKYLIFTLLVFFSIPTIFAAGNIKVATDKSSYNIDDNIELTIDINSDNQTAGEIQISNLENNFQITSRSQSNSTQVINGISENRIYFNLGLIAFRAGEYTLGPVILKYQDGEEFISESINISVSGERITINSNIIPSGTPANTGSSTIQDLSNIHLGNNTGSDISEPILGINGEVMEDIYDIKGNKYPSFLSPFAFILAGFFTGLLYVIKNINSNVPIRTKIKKIEEKTAYNQLLKSAKKQYLSSPKDIFYGKIGEIFRIYLDENIDTNISRKSLADAKKILPKNLHNMYTSIYYPAYNNATDSEQQRLKHIELLTKIFKKK